MRADPLSGAIVAIATGVFAPFLADPEVKRAAIVFICTLLGALGYVVMAAAHYAARKLGEVLGGPHDPPPPAAPTLATVTAGSRGGMVIPFPVAPIGAPPRA